MAEEESSFKILVIINNINNMMHVEERVIKYTYIYIETDISNTNNNHQQVIMNIPFENLSAKHLKLFLLSQKISIKDCIEKKILLKKLKHYL